MSSQSSAAPGTAQVTLAALRDAHRPVLIFAPNTSAEFLSQIHALSSESSDLHERDIVVVPLLMHDEGRPWGVTLSTRDVATLSPKDQASARKRFHVAPDAFTVIVIGKDGGEKLRSATPITMEVLRRTIDAMPMRQDEMRSKSQKD